MKKKHQQEAIENVIQELLNDAKASPTDDPRAFSALAVKTQMAQAILTGYQASATLQVVDALRELQQSFVILGETFDSASQHSTATLKEGLESIRRTLSSNG